ncbi:MAG TPA: DegT/DnrJ/EryC1/StrS family aminotransferase, partial [Rariglobus sp.]
MNDSFIPFHRPSIGEEEIGEVTDTLRSGWLTTGPRTARFEREFRDYTAASHSVALNSATAALHLALAALEIGPGDEVITTPMTFCATVQAILHVGAVPVLAD